MECHGEAKAATNLSSISQERGLRHNSKRLTLRFMRPTSKIAVIGTINRDSVTRPDGSVHQGYGGILYNLIPLAQLCAEVCGDDVEIWPVVKVGSDHAEEIMTRLKALPNIRLDSVRIVKSSNNHCHLTYHDSSAKSEIVRGWVGSVSKRQLEPVLDSDWILVNFVSGGDITMHLLRWLRVNASARIYMDFHSRTLGRRRDGSRFLRRPPDWKEMIWRADYLQMNEMEFEILFDEPANAIGFQRAIQLDVLNRLQALIVTLGEKGGSLVIRGAKSASYHGIGTPKVGPIRDTTGCGDIFSAVYIAARVGGSSDEAAAICAADLASRRAALDKSIENVDFRQLFRNLRDSRNR
jgi:sugar/nucleoside kinase (ribokinase family)